MPVRITEAIRMATDRTISKIGTVLMQMRANMTMGDEKGR